MSGAYVHEERNAIGKSERRDRGDEKGKSETKENHVMRGEAEMDGKRRERTRSLLPRGNGRAVQFTF